MYQAGDSPTASIALVPSHPGFKDPGYRARRDAIAQVSRNGVDSGSIPVVPYTDQENGTWESVMRELIPLHREIACREYLEAFDALALGTDHVPQLQHVSERLYARHGFGLQPTVRMAESDGFLRNLGRGRLLSTQYLRHHSRPLFSPEPDAIHDLIGHAVLLMDPTCAILSREFGAAALRTVDPVVLRQLGRLYHYTLEFGVLNQNGPRAFGAGILSSVGEMKAFASRTAELRPFAIKEVIARPYDPTDFQSTLFVLDDLRSTSDEIVRWLRRCD